ncbi:nucleoside recognition domain-containing protein [Paraburkholderia caballeronis]|uniref:Ferrous iron transport protein B n=1 Tax=Paraburkholderia caballeronis TaxID=416943 RepID=A0A1H7QI43_9BURK|nr:nucleoside recognition domain-containing protein [Paraburkholderia caballeronis]PXW22574.1 nucleoside recognition protein [Paraburkholderia caballeronis]PXW96445.1 nucleoside recognition protein [Paraburkholderia caballeronis]RAJ92856.1 nucleoside recognition protein [Paraburkholderia caballeronis]SEL46947.1 ferrous iron transport protein B [Paraburkholderia caballeronis]
MHLTDLPKGSAAVVQTVADTHASDPIAPLGFDWQISLAPIPAFAARETAVAALATVYSVAGDEADIAGPGHTLASNFPLASALSLRVWFAFAPQCMSTLAVIRRETRPWRNVAISFGYRFVVAYVAALVTDQVARHFT